METGCLEVVVNRKTNTLMKALHYGAIVLAVCFCLSAFLIHFALLFPAIGCIVGAYFSWLEPFPSCLCFEKYSVILLMLLE